MRKYFLAVIFIAMGFYDSSAQSTLQDSLDNIERQRIELRNEQARLKAKQDSLVRERLRIEQQQTIHKQQELQKQEELLRSKQQVIYSYQQLAPEVPDRKAKNIIGLAPAHMFITGVEVFYERAISKNASLQWSAGYHSMENYPDLNSNGTINTNNTSSTNLGSVFLSGDNEKVAYSGVRFQMQYKSYLFQEAGVLRKLHIGPSLLYKHDEITVMTNYTGYNAVSYTPVYQQYFAEALTGAVDVGYNIKFLRYFSVDPFVGFSYTVPLTGKYEASKVHVDFLNPYKQGFILRTGVTIGYRF